MQFKEALECIERDGFSWSMLRDYFPFGDLSIREGDFEKLVLKSLESIDCKDKRELLLDIIDTQNCIFLEQVWLQNEQYEDEADKPFTGYGTHISALLQITSNIRHFQGLKKRDTRQPMLNLPQAEMLLDRILCTRT